MNVGRVAWALFLWTWVLVPAVARAADVWLPVNVPPRTEASWVMQQARVNGASMQVLELHSRLPADELLAYFRRDWGRFGAAAPLETRQAPWRKLTVQQDPVQMVLQVQPAEGGGSHALLSQMNYRDVQRNYVPRDLPALEPLQLKQVSETWDGPKRSQLIQFGGAASFESIQQRLREHWLRQGWRTVFDRGSSQGPHQWLASFERGASSVDIVVAEAARGGALSVMVNLMDTSP